MKSIPIIMPQLGESIAEAEVIKFLVQEGEYVQMDQDIIEVETSKATFTVPAPCAGRIEKFAAKVGVSYPVRSVLGYLGAEEEELQRLGLDSPDITADAEDRTSRRKEKSVSEETEQAGVEPRVRGLPVPVYAWGASYISPRLKARMNELGLHAADLAGIAGTGAAGRVTVDDFENFIANLEKSKLTPASPMRVAVADAMRRSWTRPLALVGLPVSLDAVLKHRKTISPKPGPALYALRAMALALAENSALAGRLVGQQIVHPQSIDIGFAVEAEEGVLVPVIRNADKAGFQDIIAQYNYLLKLARQRRLPYSATGGSAATISNYGTFGLTWATPIPLPEQTLVLGLGAGRKVPWWNEKTERFEPVTEAQLTLSFDHRVLDGGAAGRLLHKIEGLLSTPDKL
ncbi:MAG: 2-oxo acid dehydrogenase subunit E2 [Verrucomicrobia bacterium]|nr:2-oxo acid dehydrogenase subunit E2 [Verrucomicrobiota bacterium]